MHRFFRYLESRSGSVSGPGSDQAFPWEKPGGKPGSKPGSKNEELSRLWESSARSEIPAPPDIDKAWQRLQRELANLDERAHTVRTARVLTLADWWPGRIAVACGAALTILLAYLAAPLLLNTSYETGRSGRLTVALPDSSTVTLCENSSLMIERGPFGGLKRTTLNGQGYFSVKPQNAPFIITTSIGSVRVVGTEFAVRSGPKQLYVAVTHGTVAVSSSSGTVDSTVYVHRGEFVLCNRGGQLGAPGKSMTGEGPMWLSGSLTFAHADLQSVCAEITRQLGVQILLNNRGLDTLKVTGLIRGTDTRQILSALCELTGTNYRSENDGYVVY